MGIITISRGTKSGGILLAEAIGERLGYKVLNRKLVLTGYPGLQEMENELWEEMNNRPPYLWESLESLRNAYVCVFRAALMEYAKEGPLVYHANGGHLLLRGTPGLLRIRIVAPMAKRLEMVTSRRGGTKLEASQYIHDKDENRVMWNRFLYNVDSLADCLYYDQVLNLDRMTIEQVTDLVEKTSTCDPFRWTDGDLETIQDIALATRVKGILMQDSNTRMIDVDVQAVSGEIAIHGTSGAEAVEGDLQRVCTAIPGVKSVSIVFDA